jgi:thiol-disulfide isomerase/thioredoxin
MESLTSKSAFWSFFISLIILIVLPGKPPGLQPNILNQRLNEVKSGTLYYSVKYKSFNHTDTNFRFYNLSFIRSGNSDSFNFILSNAKYSYAVYDNNILSYIDEGTKEIRVSEQRWQNLFPGFYFNLYQPVTSFGNLINRYVNNPTTRYFTRDTLIVKQTLKVIELKCNYPYPADSTFKNLTQKFIINIADSIPVSYISKVEWSNMEQYCEMNLLKYKINHIDSSVFLQTMLDTLRAYSGFNVIQEYDTLQKKPLLSNGCSVQDFRLHAVDNSVSWLSEIKNEYIILDFWYMGCYPCLKSIPILNNLKMTYGNKIGVIGINSIDTDTSLIKKFIARHKINYDIAYMGTEAAEKFNVRAYPTLYILNKERKVIFGEIGFSERLVNKIDSVLAR